MGDITKQGPSVSRRGFVAGSAMAGATTALYAGAVRAAPVPGEPAPGSTSARVGALPATDAAAETGTVDTSPAQQITRSGADFMTDVIKTLGIEFVAANPGSTFRGLQESLINYGENKAPEWLTCCHEETSVAMAHGYYKIAGKPMAAMVHGTVGVQHASMAIYNAYADRVPVMIISGNARDANTRRVPVEWKHSVQDNALIVRDFTKWDDTPESLQHYAESQVRAMKLACAVPGAPVMITVDMDLQENELLPGQEARLSIPKLSFDIAPQGDPGALAQAARMLAAAERPVIFAERYAHNQQGVDLLVELADLTGAAVVDGLTRMNFPNTHPLNQTGVGGVAAEADVIIALDPVDLWGFTHKMEDAPGKPWKPVVAPDCKIISIGTGDLLIKANYQDFQRYSEATLAIVGDAQASMPALIAATRQALAGTPSAPRDARRAKLADRRAKLMQQHRDLAAGGWDLTPIHPARLAMEVWEQVKDDDWSLVGSSSSSPSQWAKRLWPIEKHYHHIGGPGADGVGYALPAAVGAALANRGTGRLSINFQPDGDFMYAPGAMWTAAHHRIPMLTLIHNNGGYHQEKMHLQLMANRHDRGIDRAGIGTVLNNPGIDFARLAQGMGVYAEGPISDPGKLAAAIARALKVVREGKPALLDIVSQPR